MGRHLAPRGLVVAELVAVVLEDLVAVAPLALLVPVKLPTLHSGHRVVQSATMPVNPLPVNLASSRAAHTNLPHTWRHLVSICPSPLYLCPHSALHSPRRPHLPYTRRPHCPLQCGPGRARGLGAPTPANAPTLQRLPTRQRLPRPLACLASPPHLPSPALSPILLTSPRPPCCPSSTRHARSSLPNTPSSQTRLAPRRASVSLRRAPYLPHTARTARRSGCAVTCSSSLFAARDVRLAGCAMSSRPGGTCYHVTPASHAITSHPPVAPASPASLCSSHLPHAIT